VFDAGVEGLSTPRVRNSLLGRLTLETLRSARESGTRGVFAHIIDDDPEQLQSTLDIVVKRFAEPLDPCCSRY
jgi:hypothetical protein